MSEVAPSICPKFCRKLPQEAANDEINKIFRAALQSAVSSGKSKGYAARDQYVDAVTGSFYQQLGDSIIAAPIELMAKELPDQFVAHLKKSETPLMFVDRADYRSFAHPLVLSPLVAIKGKDSTCYVGTDKLGHFVQQGYDYWIIRKATEAQRKGLGDLYASAWGHWTEGELLSENEIDDYLKSHDLPSGEDRVRELKKEIARFLEDSDTVEHMSPTPGNVKEIAPLRKIAHFMGTHERGILGSASTGIISYADLVANEAGLRFYLDLERDPEYLAKHFDIKDYADCNWDEEVLRSNFSPVIENRIQEALRGKRDSYFVKGIGVDLNILRPQLSVSMPFFYYSSDDYELRARIGASFPLQFFTSFDVSRRISGLHYAYVSATGAATLDGFYPLLETGYEVMLLGWTSFKAGFLFNTKDLSPSAVVGALMLRR